MRTEEIGPLRIHITILKVLTGQDDVYEYDSDCQGAEELDEDAP